MPHRFSTTLEYSGLTQRQLSRFYFMCNILITLSFFKINIATFLCISWHTFDVIFTVSLPKVSVINSEVFLLLLLLFFFFLFYFFSTTLLSGIVWVFAGLLLFNQFLSPHGNREKYENNSFKNTAASIRMAKRGQNVSFLKPQDFWGHCISFGV